MAQAPEFKYAPMFQVGEDTTEYYHLTSEHVSLGNFEGKEILKVTPEALTMLIERAFTDVNFMLRRSHNECVAKILKDPESSDNDKYVALTMLRNAEVSAKGVLPICQDTGTAIIHGEKGQRVWTDFSDEEAISRGVYYTYTKNALRYSQNAPLTLYKEVNTRCNLPAQIDIEATEGEEYRFLCVVKGGGSANKTYFYPMTKATIQNEGLLTVKLASIKYYDSLPTTGDETGRAFRDVELENKLLELANNIGLGAQFGGKYLAHDVRVIRLPRHGASCPIGIGVSCSADRNVKCKINREGLWVEKLDDNPAELIPEEFRHMEEGETVKIDLNQPMEKIRAELSKHPVSTRVSLTGKIIVARDIAHAKLQERLDKGEPLPQYIKDHPVLYAGPAKTPEGYACGSMGPTTANRMDPYADPFMAAGGSHVMIAKGNRTDVVTEACKKHGGFYLGTIGGVAADLSAESIRSIKCIEYPELGMEAVYEIDVVDFPAFILVDDKGNDFFKQLKPRFPVNFEA